jgi:hypothetical protein
MRKVQRLFPRREVQIYLISKFGNNVTHLKNKKMLARVYVLKCPKTKEIRYCGQTIKTLKYRLNEHVQDSKRYNFPTAQWIKSLLEEGLKPDIELLEEIDLPEERIYEREIYHIAELSKTCNLTNVAKGGKDGSFIKNNQNAKDKIRDFMTTYKKSKEHIDKMKLSLCKPVYQYDNDGNFMKEHLGVDELNLLGYKKDTIRHACLLEGTAYKYNWRYYKQDKIEPKIPYFKSETWHENNAKTRLKKLSEKI